MRRAKCSAQRVVAIRVTTISQYLLVFVVIAVANCIPAFAPPTWMLLVYFELQFELHPAGLILTGALAATVGRAVLAYGMRGVAPRLPARYVANMDSAGRYFTRNKPLAYATVATFFFSPLSSAQLFAAAGIMRNVALKPLLAAFFGSKVVSYSVYVFGAHTIKSTDVVQLVLEEATSPIGIVVQVVLILGVVAMGLRQWLPPDPPHPVTPPPNNEQ